MPRRVISCRLIFPSGAPSNVTVPEVGRYTPVIALKHVVLPAPFGPIRPRISPRLMSNVTASNAVRPPNFTVRSVVCSSVSPSAAFTSRCSAAISSSITGSSLMRDPASLLAGPSRGRLRIVGLAQQLARRRRVREQLLSHGEQALRTEDHQHHQSEPEEQILEVAEVDAEQF